MSSVFGSDMKGKEPRPSGATDSTMASIGQGRLSVGTAGRPSMAASSGYSPSHAEEPEREHPVQVTPPDSESVVASRNHARTERSGLTSAQAAQLMEQWGPNEIPKIEVPLWKMVAKQFTGTMPLMLEICCFVSAITMDWPDFGVILGMLVVNAILGFHEEHKAKKALDDLTNSMESQVACLRDGVPLVLGVTKLVPGDVIHMRGGTMTPADVEWLEGDVLSIDTAALTGEPIPRKYPSDAYGTCILSGSTVKQGEAYCIVRNTGIRTEIGRGQADIAADRATVVVSVFEQKVLFVVNIIIALAVLDCVAIMLFQGLFRGGFKKSEFRDTLLVALSILIAAVPVALPLVMQVTMAIGAYRMATSHSAIVTRMSALQDIASMEVLCSDKTGTLTTAKMSINLDEIWVASESGLKAAGFKAESRRTQQQLLLSMACLGSNADKRDDAIDGAVLRAVDKMNSEQDGAVQNIMKSYKQITLTGFNPEVKRTVATVADLVHHSTLIVAKGLATKVMDTQAGGADAAELQWKCVELQDPDFAEKVRAKDETLAAAGYKTLAVAVGVEGEMHFLGLLPMIDPPRSDTAKTIQRITNAGVDVKMITGDHLNIAIETARLVGMPTNILPGELTREAGYTRDELVRNAGGFAQVLPRDKRECVLVLQRAFGLVVGMTGDGVNDAPALSAAQCGIAVDDATDAAKGAAAMILTSEGLSAVFGAIVESRKIFNRLSSYISYRLASTIQILLYLTILVLVFDCRLNPLYVILLALLNDITMIPVAEDRQTASSSPQHANVAGLIGFSVLLGVAQSVVSLVFYLCMDFGIIRDDAPHGNYGYPASKHAQVAIWLQVSIAAELLIFVARAPGLWFLSRPSGRLILSTMLGNVVAILLAVYFMPFGDAGNALSWEEVGFICAWDFGAMFLVDFAKMIYKYAFEHSVSGIIDEAAMAAEDSRPAPRHESDLEASRNRMSVPLTGTHGSQLHSSHSQSGSLLASVTDFLATGKAPYTRSLSSMPSGSSHNDNTSTGMRSRLGASLHPRTPAAVAQQRQLYRSWHPERQLSPA